MIRCSCRIEKQVPPPDSAPVRACSSPTSKAPGQRDRILFLLRKRGTAGATNADFVALGIFRYSSRLHELRRQGYRIATLRVSEGVFCYRLIGEAAEVKPLRTYQAKGRQPHTPSLFLSGGMSENSR